MSNQTVINNIFSLLDKKRLGAAIRAFGPLAGDTLFADLADRVAQVKGDYDLMLSYMGQGYDDPQRGVMYQHLLGRMYTIVANADVAWRTRNVSTYIQAAQRTAKRDMTADGLKQRIEQLVADEAMLQLEDNEDRREMRMTDLYQQHYDLTQWAFDKILVSKQWKEDEALAMQQLMLAPTVDTHTVALLVAAVMLACINVFDKRKWMTLLTVYRQSADDKVRIRALVGWVFALPQRTTLFNDVGQAITEALDDKQALTEVLQLQRQVVLCMNAEQDTRQIQQDIMPTIIKNNADLTKSDLDFQDDDSLRDILDPDAEDRAMEELEQCVQQMMDMQNKGADIYFGGFSMMKRFGFFYQLVNWFRPYDDCHPELAHSRRKLRGTDFLAMLGLNGPFCDSDKYSFALAMASVVDKLPQQVRQMLGQAEVFGPVQDPEVIQGMAYQRRMYLQDLYRFFRLADDKTAFDNPFANDNVSRLLFVSNPLLAGCLPAGKMLNLGAFLLKQKRFDCLSVLIECCGDMHHNHDWCMLKGTCLMHDKRYDLAAIYLEQALAGNQNDKKTLVSLARAYCNASQFDQAASVYDRLCEAYPENTGYAVHLASVLLRTGKQDNVDRAVNVMYQYYFSHEDDINVLRVLAWALLCKCNVQRATQFYDKILARDNDKSPADCLNAAYCQWAMGNLAQTATLLGGYLALKGGKHPAKDLYNDIMADKQILVDNNINEDEIFMMVDLVTRNNES